MRILDTKKVAFELVLFFYHYKCICLYPKIMKKWLDNNSAKLEEFHRQKCSKNFYDTLSKLKTLTFPFRGKVKLQIFRTQECEGAGGAKRKGGNLKASQNSNFSVRRMSSNYHFSAWHRVITQGVAGYCMKVKVAQYNFSFHSC